jgi:tripartite-type tricarboxylate transporter receptor subunit TctC
MPSRRSLIAFLAVLPGLARAQSAPLRIVFPFGAGGAADAVARMLAEQLGAALGRPAIVENRTGAGGRLGAQAVRGAAPDGATLLFAAGAQMVLQPHTDPALGYDPVADFRPVAQVMRFGQVVAVGPDNPARDVQGLLAWYRADPARRSFGSPGIGTGAHFVGLEIGRLGGVALEHVPYRGTPAALPDLQSGRLAMFVASFAEFREHAAAGRVRLIAGTDAARMPAAPDLPTLREQGIDVVAPGWFALYAPAGTPDAVVARLAAAVAEAVGAGGLGPRIAAMGFEPSGAGPAAVAATQREESARWAAMVRASGFRPA